MRGGRSLLLLLALALGLGAYVYFVEWDRDLTPAGEAREKVFTVETGAIDEVQVTSAAGESTTIRRNGGEWEIVAPLTAPADQTSAGSIASALETLEIQRTIEENPPSVAPFGLDPARFHVAFKTGTDSALRRLQIGAKTPTGSDLYARVEGQPKVFLISAYLEDSLNRSTFDLRDKTVLKFSRGDVDALSLHPAGSPATILARTGNTWRLTAPVAARADWTPVDGLVSRIAEARMTGIVPLAGAEPTAAELRTFGLDAPGLVATVGAGSTAATLALGAKKDDASVYARDLSRPLVFTVEQSLVDELRKPPEDLRVKDVFEFKSFSAAGLSVIHGGVTESFAKTTTPGTDASPASEVWKQTAPEAKDVNLTAMTDLLNTLSSLRAVTFVDRAPTAGDDVVVVARFGDPAALTEERVTFRRTGGTVHALRSDEPGAAIVPVEEFNKALTQLKDLASAK